MLSNYRKLIAALAGAALEAVSLGLLHGEAAHVVTIGVGVLTAAGVYVAPNTV